ncbi:MAG: GNAT family N-acetyltransferase [Anaerolineales bacterium]
MTLLIGIYDDSSKDAWDQFVRRSKNGTFLFFRDYMDYHQDRFEDHSLLVWDAKGHLIAVLPANSQDDVLVSHGGLTYGGFVTDDRMKAGLMLEVFEDALAFLKQRGFVKLVYKAVPHIYHRIPAEEDTYAMFRYGASLYRRDVTSVVIPALGSKFQDRRSRSIRKALRSGVTWGPSERYDEFWPILEQNLMSKHGATPVHTLPEIMSLQTAFPKNIRFFCALVHDEIAAGTVIYETDTVAHAQYIASSEAGRTYGALDLLFSELILDQYSDKKFFDFGISTESDGRYLNKGLTAFKEGFGGRSVTHDFYEINLAGTRDS